MWKLFNKPTITNISVLFLMLSTLNAQDYAVGADLSFVKEAEESGFVFKDNNQAKPCLDIFNPQLLSASTLGRSGYLYNSTPLVVMSSLSKLGLSHFLRVSSTISQIRLLSRGSPPSMSIVAGAILCAQLSYH